MTRATILVLTMLLGCSRNPPAGETEHPREAGDETAGATGTGPAPAGGERPETATDVDAPEPTEPPPPGDSPTRVRVTAAAAAERGLPAVGFSFDTVGTPMHSGTFPEDGTAAYASGPPGGVQTLRVESCDEAPEAAGALERHVRTRYSDERLGPLVVGEPTEVGLAGAQRPALPFVTGQSMARSNHCAIAVADPAGGPRGLVVVVAHSDLEGEPDCAVPLANEQLARVLGTFRLE
ncbi:MAG: hypothetical protein JXB32_26035 [Deltaproteobacteria bacterium]|nr:hypothetical protein [Deltaproteobacteria bacterium]